MTPKGLTVSTKPDGQVWLHFDASTGNSASISMGNLIERKHGVTARAIREWCLDQHEPPCVWLREVDAGTGNACWVVCAKGDPGAVKFMPGPVQS